MIHLGPLDDPDFLGDCDEFGAMAGIGLVQAVWFAGIAFFAPPGTWDF